MAVDSKVKTIDKPEKRSIMNFFTGLKAELKRITWPAKKDVKKATAAVGILCLIYVVYVSVVDFAFQNLFNLIFGIK